MSLEAVRSFYRKLESDPVLREEALALKTRFPDQAELIRAFVALGERHGSPFTPEELLQYIFAHGKAEQ